MIKHIVLFRLKKEMLQEEKVSLMKRFKQEIEALPNDIDFIRKIEVGLNVNPAEDFDIALYSEFDDMEDVMEADSMAYSAAYRFNIWDDEWIDAMTLAKEFGAESSSVLASVKKGWIERTDTAGVMSVAYVSEIVPAGKMSPREYCAPFIKDMIISVRKQELVSTLERELLRDARESGKFEILK